MASHQPFRVQSPLHTAPPTLYVIVNFSFQECCNISTAGILRYSMRVAKGGVQHLTHPFLLMLPTMHVLEAVIPVLVAGNVLLSKVSNPCTSMACSVRFL